MRKCWFFWWRNISWSYEQDVYGKHIEMWNTDKQPISVDFQFLVEMHFLLGLPVPAPMFFCFSMFPHSPLCFVLYLVTWAVYFHPVGLCFPVWSCFSRTSLIICTGLMSHTPCFLITSLLHKLAIQSPCYSFSTCTRSPFSDLVYVSALASQASHFLASFLTHVTLSFPARSLFYQHCTCTFFSHPVVSGHIPQALLIILLALAHVVYY